MSQTDKNYILFHCHHLSALHEFIVLKYKFHMDDDVVIMVYNDMFCDSEFAYNLVKNNIFKAVIKSREPKNFDEMQQEQFIIHYYDKFFKDNGLSFGQIKCIYTASDLNNMFPIYCITQQKPLIYIEMYSGQFADKKRYEFCTSVFGYPDWLEELYRKYSSLSGDDSSWTLRRYLCHGSIAEYDEKDIIIDFIDEFYSLPEKYKEKIINCFKDQINNYTSFNNFVIINSLRWTRLYTKLDSPYHYLPYLLILDYFCEDDTFIKNHPQTGYDKYFDEYIKPLVNTAPAIIPIEFYGLMDGFKINRLISVESSSNSKIERFIKKSLHLGIEYFHIYRYLHRLYILKCIVSAVGGTYHCPCADFNINFIDSMKAADQSAGFRSYDEKGIGSIKWYIIPNEANGGNIEFQSIKSKEVIVFFDSDMAGKSLFIMKEMFPQAGLVIIKLSKKSIRENILSDENEEYMYLLCPDQKIIEALGSFSLSYELKYTGLYIQALTV